MALPQTHDRPHDGKLPPLLATFQWRTAVFFVLSLLFHLVERARHIGAFQGSPLSRREDRFSDFTIFVYKFKFFHTAAFFTTGFPINYPAPAALGFEFFFRLTGQHPLRVFLAFCVLSFVVPAALFARSLARRGIAPLRAGIFMLVLTAFSWPVMLLLDRANIEVLVFIAIATGMWAYATGRPRLAAVFFGLGASLKLFPFVLFGLYLSRGQWSKIALGALVFFAVSILSLAILGPSVPTAYHGLAMGMANFRQNYMGMWLENESGVDHSIFGLIKTVLVLAFHHGVAFGRSLNLYLAVTAVGGLLLYFLRIRVLPLLNQVLLLTIASIYFTAFSGDGTLIHLYAPLAMLFLLAIQAYREQVEVPGLRLMLGCLLFILSVTTFLVFRGYRFIGPAKCIALAILLVAALRYPLGPPLGSTPSEKVLSVPDLGWLKRRSA